MRLVHNQEAGSRRQAGRRARLSSGAALVVALAVAGATASGAGAAQSAGAAVASFCGLANGVSSTLNPSTQFVPSASTSLASLESKMKTAFEKVHSEEPMIIAAAPSSIQGDMRAVFAVDNVLIGDLNKVNWNFIALAGESKQLQAEFAKIQKPVKAIEAYFASSCHKP
jgi:hypothetical protein